MISTYLFASHAAAQGPTSEHQAGAHDASLHDMLVYAEQHAPILAVASRRRGEADAERAGAESLFATNPTLELALGPRFSGTADRDYDVIFGLAQAVEIGGQRGARLQIASRVSDRVNAESNAAQWALRRDVTLAYRAAVIARERVSSAARSSVFAEDMLRIAQRRLTAGEGTIVDVQLAEVELARARQGSTEAAREERTASIRLAEVTGWPLDVPPRPNESLTPPPPVPPLSSWMSVVKEHPSLRVHRAALAEASARVELADRDAWPTPAFGLQVTREGSAGSPANFVVLGTLGTVLPIWQLNQAERTRRRADEQVLQAEESLAARLLMARLAQAHAELSAATERVHLFASVIEPKLAESLAQLRRGLDAGELSVAAVAAAREHLLVAERERLTAYGDAFRARAELEFALGAELGAELPARELLSTLGEAP